MLPGNKTGAQLTVDKPIRQNFLSFIFCTAATVCRSELAREELTGNAGYQRPRVIVDDFSERARSYRFVRYLPDLILVQLRVNNRRVAGGRSLIAYSLAFTSSDG